MRPSNHLATLEKDWYHAGITVVIQNVIQKLLEPVEWIENPLFLVGNLEQALGF